MSTRHSLGNKIKTLRLQMGYSQEKLAELADLNVRSLSRIETGNGLPSVETINRLSAILNFEINTLLKDEALPYIPKKKPQINKLLKIIENFPDEKLDFLIETAKMLDNLPFKK